MVPNSGVAPTYFSLVKYEHAEGVDLDPDVIWILAVGSDARRGQDPLRSRGDTLQLVGMDTRTGAATAIGIPRDSWVPIPGHGSNRVNAALYFGGPQLLGETVAGLIGIEPDYVFVRIVLGRRAGREGRRSDHGPQPGLVLRPLPQAQGLQGREGRPQRLQRRVLRPDPQEPGRR